MKKIITRKYAIKLLRQGKAELGGYLRDETLSGYWISLDRYHIGITQYFFSKNVPNDLYARFTPIWAEHGEAWIGEIK